MGHAAQRAPWIDLDSWAALDGDDRRELVDGVLEEPEVPTYFHETIVTAMLLALSAWIKPRGGFVFGPSSKIAVGPRSGRIPDVSVFFAASRRPAGRDAVSRVPPDVVVEVVTDRPRYARRDRVAKRRDYASCGVRFYWIVDPQLRTVEVLRLRRGKSPGYADALVVAQGRHPVPGHDGLVLDVDALWAELDRLGEK